MSFSDKHIFFDLDRTLWDFDENSEQALMLIIDHFNLTELFGSFDRFYRAYVKHNSRLWGQYGKGLLKNIKWMKPVMDLTLCPFQNPKSVCGIY